MSALSRCVECKRHSRRATESEDRRCVLCAGAKLAPISGVELASPRFGQSILEAFSRVYGPGLNFRDRYIGAWPPHPSETPK